MKVAKIVTLSFSMFALFLEFHASLGNRAEICNFSYIWTPGEISCGECGKLQALQFAISLEQSLPTDWNIRIQG